MFEYFRWKRMARKAIEAQKTAPCALCDDPIVPGDFVGICTVGSDSKERMVHTGFHFTIDGRNAFCETGAVGCGIWDGERVAGIGESLAAKAIRTGQPQVS
jgi:hypothetical protein